MSGKKFSLEELVKKAAILKWWVCKTQPCWVISVTLPGASGDGGCWSSGGSELCLHESFAVCKERWLQKSSIISHLLSFSTAPTCLEGFSLEQCIRIGHAASLNSCLLAAASLSFALRCGIGIHSARADTEPQSCTCLNYLELLRSSSH